MKHIYLFYLQFFYVQCNVLFNVKNKNDATVATEIISNYLHTYFECEEHFLSISSLSHNDNQKYFQRDIISNLIVHSKLENFTYNVLNKIDQKREGNKNVFNLVLVDRSASIV